MKYGIEFEFFVSKDNKIIPAYLATENLDGNPFLGEIKTQPLDNILDCVFQLKKLIYLEKTKLEAKGFKMEILPIHQFSNEELITFRKDQKALNKKELEVLEEFSIYPNGKLGKLLKRGEIKASLQINFSEHKTFNYPEYSKVTVEDKYKYELSTKTKQYACLFNYVSIIQKLDDFYKEDISKSNRTKGVYSIKPGDFGDRIEYRSLPNTINFENLISLLKP
jgi:hypothetical protein